MLALLFASFSLGTTKRLSLLTTDLKDVRRSIVSVLLLKIVSDNQLMENLDSVWTIRIFVMKLVVAVLAWSEKRVSGFRAPNKIFKSKVLEI